MGKVRVSAFSLSLDGFGAGVDQTLEAPLGVHGEELHGWVFETQFFQKMHGKGASSGPPKHPIDEGFATRAMENVGAWILGRNMFGPVRGPWPDESWKGWWGESPPYHVPTFVLTHHPRKPLEMKGGTTFHFVTDGPQVALARAKDAAGDKDVRIGGGVATVLQYVRERQVDELHLAMSPVLLGRGERFFGDVDWRALGYTCTSTVAGEKTTHLILSRRP